ncbi:peptidoglycan editing factor PgeF [Pseudolysobacter antarcticus]|uniref:Purine nucleoside phosphorylase n=1 Tax=Pseudolysobacter antarcticus TaxID=2511995 RepID=A0A411HGF1_9GAMM|nr:peptidoglycan editing factor PgeF [Pseudolysobacter antarcticus]QBB69596.1 peptidoglycan editing factor PgeF [Pseudolysobacter antarcticus]
MTIKPAWPPNPQQWVLPDWPAPASVRACVSTRLGPGVSLAPFDRFNLGSRCGDVVALVEGNRAALTDSLSLPAPPAWLHQVHGTTVVEVDAVSRITNVKVEAQADASITCRRGSVLAILTADCMPLLIAAADGSEIAAIHAGWRGLCDGIIEACIFRLKTPCENLLVWLGPAIGPRVYEVGDEVRAAFVTRDPQAVAAFQATSPGHWLCDLYMLARQRLAQLGITRIYGGDLCTLSDSDRFYSHRRDQISGRMASLIWIQ